MKMLILSSTVGIIGIIILIAGHISNLHREIKDNVIREKHLKLHLESSITSKYVSQDTLNKKSAELLKRKLYINRHQYIFFNNTTGELALNPDSIDGFEFIGLL